MKKTHLLAATALVAVLLVSGFADVNAADKAAPQKTTTEATAQQMPMKHGMQGMSEESRKMMQGVMEKVREENKALFDEAQAKHKELQKIMKAPTFDKEAYLNKKEEVQTLHHKMSKARSEAMASVLEKMKPEERAKMGEGMMHGPRGMMKGGKGMGRGGMMNPECPMMGGDMPMDDVSGKKPAKE